MLIRGFLILILFFTSISQLFTKYEINLLSLTIYSLVLVIFEIMDLDWCISLIDIIIYLPEEKLWPTDENSKIDN